MSCNKKKHNMKVCIIEVCYLSHRLLNIFSRGVLRHRLLNTFSRGVHILSRWVLIFSRWRRWWHWAFSNVMASLATSFAIVRGGYSSQLCSSRILIYLSPSKLFGPGPFLYLGGKMSVYSVGGHIVCPLMGDILCCP